MYSPHNIFFNYPFKKLMELVKYWLFLYFSLKSFLVSSSSFCLVFEYICLDLLLKDFPQPP